LAVAVLGRPSLARESSSQSVSCAFRRISSSRSGDGGEGPSSLLAQGEPSEYPKT
jgi:hypothetical protein